MTFTSRASATFTSLSRLRTYVIIGTLPALLHLVLSWIDSKLFGITGLISGLCIAQIGVGLGALVWLKQTMVSAGLVPAQVQATAAPVQAPAAPAAAVVSEPRSSQ